MRPKDWLFYSNIIQEEVPMTQEAVMLMHPRDIYILARDTINNNMIKRNKLIKEIGTNSLRVELIRANFALDLQCWMASMNMILLSLIKSDLKDCKDMTGEKEKTLMALHWIIQLLKEWGLYLYDDINTHPMAKPFTLPQRKTKIDRTNELITDLLNSKGD